MVHAKPQIIVSRILSGFSARSWHCWLCHCPHTAISNKAFKSFILCVHRWLWFYEHLHGTAMLCLTLQACLSKLKRVPMQTGMASFMYIIQLSNSRHSLTRNGSAHRIICIVRLCEHMHAAWCSLSWRTQSAGCLTCCFRETRAPSPWSSKGCYTFCKVGSISDWI